jgi:hypothetical protein
VNEGRKIMWIDIHPCRYCRRLGIGDGITEVVKRVSKNERDEHPNSLIIPVNDHGIHVPPDVACCSVCGSPVCITIEHMGSPLPGGPHLARPGDFSVLCMNCAANDFPRPDMEEGGSQRMLASISEWLRNQDVLVYKNYVFDECELG